MLLLSVGKTIRRWRRRGTATWHRGLTRNRSFAGDDWRDLSLDRCHRRHRRINRQPLRLGCHPLDRLTVLGLLAVLLRPLLITALTLTSILILEAIIALAALRPIGARFGAWLITIGGVTAALAFSEALAATAIAVAVPIPVYIAITVAVAVPVTIAVAIPVPIPIAVIATGLAIVVAPGRTVVARLAAAAIIA
ncbi:MAG: hypothetical protein ABL904_17755 [Hyphomicrobiaceae bacterium]